MGRGKAINEEERVRIIEALGEGTSARAIAAELGRSRQAVHNVQRDALANGTLILQGEEEEQNRYAVSEQLSQREARVRSGLCWLKAYMEAVEKRLAKGEQLPQPGSETMLFLSHCGEYNSALQLVERVGLEHDWTPGAREPGTP